MIVRVLCMCSRSFARSLARRSFVHPSCCSSIHSPIILYYEFIGDGNPGIIYISYNLYPQI